jgi:outer membrane protein assembly factor BamB
MRCVSRRLFALSCLVWLGSVVDGRAVADDWPAWRGSRRDGISRETGLLQDWPKGGPRLAWKTKGIGEGFSGPAVVGNVLYTMGNRQGKEWVFALDVAQGGRQVWASDTGTIFPKTKSGDLDYGGGGRPGPRSTPTIDGGRLYTLGINGNLVCMDLRDGRVLWRRDLVRDFGGGIPHWGYAESVLVDGPWVLCTPGGAKATIVALAKRDGKQVWASPIGDPAAYSSIIPFTAGEVKQYVTLTAKGIVGVRAKDGKFLWRYSAPSNTVANIATCVTFRQTVFGASGYGVGGGLVWIQRTTEGFNAKEMYFTKKMQNHHGGFILHDGALYGCSNPDVLTCLDYQTGRVQWTDRSCGKCSLLYADGRLYCRSERGPISLVAATPAGFELHGRFDQPDRSPQMAWPHLVIADGRLYVRDEDLLLCYEVRAK